MPATVAVTHSVTALGLMASYALVVSEPELPRTRVTLIRHGESNVTVERVIGGRRSCTGLSQLGRQQAARLAERLVATAEVESDTLLSSDFPRAVETAEIVRQAFVGRSGDAGIQRIAGFGEHDPGPEIDGMSFDDYVDRYGSPDWAGDPDTVIFPGGETTREFHARVHLALEDLLREFHAKRVVVVCHGGVIDAALRWFLGYPVTGGFEAQALNTSITEFVAPSGRSGVWRLARYNDAAHLAGLPVATPRTQRHSDGRIGASASHGVDSERP